jgi:hypothetical protein
VNDISSAFGIALHMHQPLILDEGDLRTARVVGNLEFHDGAQARPRLPRRARVPGCYSRIADFIRELVDAGRRPRIMLDYSGELLFGLRQMGRGDVLEN